MLWKKRLHLTFGNPSFKIGRSTALKQFFFIFWRHTLERIIHKISIRFLIYVPFSYTWEHLTRIIKHFFLINYHHLSIQTSPSLHAQRTKLERAQMGDKLRQKIASRPDRQELVHRHILEVRRLFGAFTAISLFFTTESCVFHYLL